MTRKLYYDRYRRAGRCVNCSQPTDYGVRCWRCARKHNGDPLTERERLNEILAGLKAEIAEQDAQIARLEEQEEQSG
jgi:hypothetical protein